MAADRFRTQSGASNTGSKRDQTYARHILRRHHAITSSDSSSTALCTTTKHCDISCELLAQNASQWDRTIHFHWVKFHLENYCAQQIGLQMRSVRECSLEQQLNFLH
jgi:hypothetical protein